MNDNEVIYKLVTLIVTEDPIDALKYKDNGVYRTRAQLQVDLESIGYPNLPAGEEVGTGKVRFYWFEVPFYSLTEHDRQELKDIGAGLDVNTAY